MRYLAGDTLNNTFFQRRGQRRAYRSGLALVHHIRSAHNGVEDPDCPACAEIRVKSTQAVLAWNQYQSTIGSKP